MSTRMDGLRAMARLVVQGLRARGQGGDEQPVVPRRRPAVEKTGIAIDARRVARYLAATDGKRIEAFRGEGAVAPPIYCATWETAATLELFAGLEKPLPLGGVVHLESETITLRPLHAGDVVRCRVELERADRVSKGVRLALTARNWNAAGILCTQSSAVFLARARAPAGPSERRMEEHGADGAPPEEWRELSTWHLRGGDGRRYAAVSGDYNPIHLWPATARIFGFRRPILHGFATEARVAHALIERLLGGDPAALRRVRIAFRAPLPLPSRPVLSVGEAGGHHWFRVADAAGEKVHAIGTYCGATADDSA